ncbi:DddA-like double-stranded DNA deaminase toxin [Actinosynnema pretiosum]
MQWKYLQAERSLLAYVARLGGVLPTRSVAFPGHVEPDAHFGPSPERHQPGTAPPGTGRGADRVGRAAGGPHEHISRMLSSGFFDGKPLDTKSDHHLRMLNYASTHVEPKAAIWARDSGVLPGGRERSPRRADHARVAARPG